MESAGDWPVQGLLVHIAGGTENGFRVRLTRAGPGTGWSAGPLPTSGALLLSLRWTARTTAAGAATTVCSKPPVASRTIKVGPSCEGCLADPGGSSCHPP